MAQALTPAFLLAALVLCVAGVAKLHSPAGAARAAATAGLPSSPLLVRVFALAELAVGGWCLASPAPAGEAVLAAAYATFTVLTVVLARRHAACGCFGEADIPASGVQSLLSGVLALVAFASVAAGAHGIGWVLGRPPAELASLLVATLGATYGTVLAYTELPRAWASWSGR